MSGYCTDSKPLKKQYEVIKNMLLKIVTYEDNISELI